MMPAVSTRRMAFTSAMYTLPSGPTARLIEKLNRDTDVAGTPSSLPFDRPLPPAMI